MTRILVGVDGSDGSDAAMAWALPEARLRGATLVLAHSWHASSLYGTEFASPWALPSGGEEEVAKAVLEDARTRVIGPDPGVVVETELVEGSAGEVLVSLAADCDLVVVGSRGHSNVVSILLGSVSQHCAHHCPCPVVIVPTPPER